MTSSPMVQMSRAIRTVIESNATGGEANLQKLQSLPDLALVEFAQIVQAFALDLRAEVERRQLEESL